MILISVSIFSSCRVTHTYVGDYKKLTEDGEVNNYVYDETKQSYLIGGLVPLGGYKHAQTPETSCEIITQITFVDALLSGITMNFYKRQHITVKAVLSDGRKEVAHLPEKEEKGKAEKAPKEKVVKEKVPKEPVPLAESGWEFEGESGIPYLFDLALLYKFNNHLSLGFNWGLTYPGDVFSSYPNIRFYGHPSMDGALPKVCFKANYRILDKNFTPFVSLEFGGYDKAFSYYDKYRQPNGVDKFCLGFSCAAGILYRFNANQNPNNAIGFKVGYERASGTLTDYHAKLKVHTIIMMLTFTHTFNSKWSKLEGKGTNWKLPIGN
ncbi:MAG: hypothetical protein IKR41_12640 [Bacteroidales bacterium]|nr:hypothetical protein [Bacteroidales bacterium]